jgi:hypothetical protein
MLVLLCIICTILLFGASTVRGILAGVLAVAAFLIFGFVMLIGVIGHG